MPGLFIFAWLPVSGGPAVSPLAAATGDIVSYILGYGVLGIVVLAYAFRLVVPGKAADKLAADARADLIDEIKRLIEEKNKAEAQRDEALKIAQEKLIPMLTSFAATTQSLIPLLQDVVREREERVRGRLRG